MLFWTDLSPERCLSKVCSISLRLRASSGPWLPQKQGTGSFLPSQHLAKWTFKNMNLNSEIWITTSSLVSTLLFQCMHGPRWRYMPSLPSCQQSQLWLPLLPDTAITTTPNNLAATYRGGYTSRIQQAGCCLTILYTDLFGTQQAGCYRGGLQFPSMGPNKLAGIVVA